MNAIGHQIDLGPRIFGLAILCFGIQNLSSATHLLDQTPGPPWSPQSVFFNYIFAVVLMVSGLAIALNRRRRPAAGLLAVVLSLQAAIFYLPGLITNLRNPQNWTSVFELLALCGVSIVLTASFLSATASSEARSVPAGRARQFGRLLFAASLVVFAVQHFLYASFIAADIPAWIPAHLFFAYFVGFAFVCAALAIVVRAVGHLGSNCLGVMFLLWVFVLHAPRILAAPHNGTEWTSAFVALAMCGGAWSL